MMKGLLFRELYLGRKFYLSTFIVQFITTGLAFLVLLSMKIGNLANLDDSIIDMEFFNGMIKALFIVALPVIYFCITGENGVHISDIKSRYYLFYDTLPVSAFQKTMIKYIIKFSLFVYALGMSMLSAWGYTVMNGIAFDRNIYLMVLAVALLALMINTYQDPLILLCKSQKAITKISGSVFVILALCYFGFAFYMMSEIQKYQQLYPDDEMKFLDDMLEKLNSLVDNFAIYVPFLMIAFFVISFVCSYFAIKRREK
ncbi:MAG: hypothetical protein K2H93_04695 [Oscillospiraceae bacterium]|nr:hypothetical protein [Oscillospiraceae bacterium]